MTLRVLSDVLSVINNFLSYEGEWYFRTIYEEGDIISYNGALYAAKNRIDQSGSAVQIRYDNFHRANIADGWGVATDGNVWTDPFSTNPPGTFYLQNNVGFAGTGSGSGDLKFGNDLTTDNIEILLKFSGTNFSGDAVLEIDYRYNYATFASGLSTYISIASGVPRADQLSLDGIGTNGSSYRIYNPVNLSPFPLIDGTDYFYRVTISGNYYANKLWKASDTEPATFTESINTEITTTDKTFAVYFQGDIIFKFKEFTVFSIPDAPDINTTNWLLVE